MVFFSEFHLTFEKMCWNLRIVGDFFFPVFFCSIFFLRHVEGMFKKNISLSNYVWIIFESKMFSSIFDWASMARLGSQKCINFLSMGKIDIAKKKVRMYIYICICMNKLLLTNFSLHIIYSARLSQKAAVISKFFSFYW